jgi:hypothetical protein
MATSSIKTLWLNDDPRNYSEYVQFNDRKFKIRIRYTNSTCIGFNADCALSIMTSNGSFTSIIDDRQAGIKFDQMLCYSTNINELIEANKNIIKEFKNFIKKVYA